MVKKVTTTRKSTSRTTGRTTSNTAAAKRASARKAAANPTLHGLLISRTMSGTVVRGLTFAVLVLGLVVVGVSSATGFSGLSALGTWLLLTAGYLLFDIIYVLLSKVRPLHPRLDRAVLPFALLFALAATFTPVVAVTTNGINVVNIWLAGGVGLLAILGVRIALLVASAK